MIKTITVAELQNLQANNSSVTIIDVREPYEYQAANITGTHLIPLHELSVSVLPTTQGPIILSCNSGRRSITACEILLAEEPNLDVYSLEGGIKAWIAAGLAVNRI